MLRQWYLFLKHCTAVKDTVKVVGTARHSAAYHLLRVWHGLPPLPYLGQQLAYIRDDESLNHV